MAVKRSKGSLSDPLRHNLRNHVEGAVDRASRYASKTSNFLTKVSDAFQSIPEKGRPKSTEQQIVHQSRLILRDYLQHEVKRARSSSSRPLVTVSRITPSTANEDADVEEKSDIIGSLLKLEVAELSDVSQKVILIGKELEIRYPNLFKGVANNLRVNLHSPNQLITAYMTVSSELFRFGITWLRIIALIVITKSLFLECLTEGNDQHSFNLVDAFQKVVRRRLTDWIIMNGGWIGLAFHVEKHRESRLSVWFYSILGMFLGVSCTWLLPWTLWTYHHADISTSSQG